MLDGLAAYWTRQFAEAGTLSDEQDHWQQALHSLFQALEEGNTAVEYNDTLHSQNPLLTVSRQQAISGLGAPIVYDGNLIWLYRIWSAEETLTDLLLKRAHLHPLPIADTVYHTKLTTEQNAAVHHGLSSTLTIINGGPGTGKTFTIACLVQYLQNCPDNAIRIALAAPTGKAAKRMDESLHRILQASPHSTTMLQPAQTLHRLLGIGRNATPIYNSQLHLPYDIVIVDEASMLSLEMAYLLLQALSPQTRLILLGDAEQLAAVEPGAVLHDLSRHPAMRHNLVTLTQSTRFSTESDIGTLARAVQHYPQIPSTEEHDFFSLLDTAKQLTWHRKPSELIYRQLFEPYSAYLEALCHPRSTPQQLFHLYDDYRILCAGHHGTLGTTQINRAMMQLHRAQQQEADNGTPYYHGLPIMVTENNYALDIYNGDIGLCLYLNKQMQIHFLGRAQPLLLDELNPSKWLPAYALTIHKSQGSEYRHVAIALPHEQRQLSKELLYTGITRARTQLTLFARRETLDFALRHPSKRLTGLGKLFDLKKDLPLATTQY